VPQLDADEEVKPEYWPEATAHLGKQCKVLRKLIRKHPDVEIISRGDAFNSLARAIVGQQISVKAAQSIWARFAALMGGKVTPANVRKLTETQLRSAGFSSQKIKYVTDLAMRFDEGLVKPRRWARMDNEAIIEELTQVKGIGRWTVEMFLMFHLHRPDVLPVGDLGLRRAMETLYNEGAELTKDEMHVIGAAWAPYRTVASWYLWRSLEP
jgi:DNA-3-methyladenine glycosylase II